LQTGDDREMALYPSFLTLQGAPDDEVAALKMVRDSIKERTGLDCRDVSVGEALRRRTDLDGITELRPFDSILFDVMAVERGLCGWEDVALTVLCTVTAIRDEHYVVDAGASLVGPAMPRERSFGVSAQNADIFDTAETQK
jgi:D-serine deaminase-like pyridoxal phosphate-dependent protein